MSRDDLASPPMQVHLHLHLITPLVYASPQAWASARIAARSASCACACMALAQLACMRCVTCVGHVWGTPKVGPRRSFSPAQHRLWEDAVQADAYPAALTGTSWGVRCLETGLSIHVEVGGAQA